MKLEKLLIKNIKGINASVEFGDVNLIYGKNASGKTAILDSIRLSCLGYHPVLGKTAKGIKLLSSGSDVSCTSIFDNKEISSFSIENSGNGTASKKFLPANGIDDLLIQLDPDVYYGSTSDQKRDLILCTNPSSDLSSVKSKIVNEISKIRQNPSSLELEIIINLTDFINKTFKDKDNLNDVIAEISSFLKENIQKSSKAKTLTKNKIYDFAVNTEDIARDYPIEYLKNEKNRISTLIRENEEKEILQGRIAKEINENKLELERLVGLDSKKPNFSKIQQLESDLEKTSLAYNEQIDKLEDKLNNLIQNESNKILALNECSDIPFEKALEKLPNGQFILKVEVNKDKEEVGSLVWSCEEFNKAKNTKIDSIYEEIESVKKERNQTLLDLKNEIQDLEEQKSKYDNKQTKTYIEKKIQELQTEFIGTKQLNAISENIKTLQVQLEEYEIKIKEFEIHQAKVREIEKSQTDLKDWEIENRLLLDCKKSIEEISKKIQGDIFASLLDSLNLFTNELEINSYAIVDSEIGYLKNDRFISYKTFSGSEKCILDCALTIALAIQGNCKIAIIDELGRFDEARKRKMYLAVKSLIKQKLLDQAIFVDVVLPLSVDDINIIDICMI